MSEASIRSKIHSFWQSFFPSLVFFAIFAGVWTALLGVHNVARVFDPVIRLARLLGSEAVNKRLKDLELLKLVPLAVVFVIGFLLYIFDRSVDFIGRVLPPYPRWEGSPTLYIAEYLRKELWMLLPSVSNPVALDFEARVIIDQAEAEHKLLRDGPRSYFQTRFSSAARLSNFAKAGFLWVVLSSLWALILGRSGVAVVLIAALSIMGFAVLGFVALVLETHWLIKENEADVRAAIAILYSRNIRPSQSEERREEFEKGFVSNVRYSRRFVNLTWGSLENYAGLYRAFVGFRKDKPPGDRQRCRRDT